jgi:hypothetical protein
LALIVGDEDAAVHRGQAQEGHLDTYSHRPSPVVGMLALRSLSNGRHRHTPPMVSMRVIEVSVRSTSISPRWHRSACRTYRWGTGARVE